LIIGIGDSEPGDAGLKVTSRPASSTIVHCESDGQLTPWRLSDPPLLSRVIGPDHLKVLAAAALEGCADAMTSNRLIADVAQRTTRLGP
jgi:hypothetical protein